LLQRWSARPARELRLCETLALGERRFLAVVEFGPRRFLIGGSGSSVVLLAQLPSAGPEETAGPDGKI
jgi:flagellar biogenesis protein FliO